MKIIKKELAEIARQNQKLEAENARLEATLTYVAMMADVELPTDEEKEGVENV